MLSLQEKFCKKRNSLVPGIKEKICHNTMKLWKVFSLGFSFWRWWWENWQYNLQLKSENDSPSKTNINFHYTIINQLVTWPSNCCPFMCPCLSSVSNSAINSSNMSNQTGLYRCIGDKVHSALLHTYTCRVQNALWSLMGWVLTNKSVWAITVDLCTEMFTYTHFLFLWAPVPYYSCWLITKPRLRNGSCPSNQCLPHLGDLIGSLDQQNGYFTPCVHDSHTQVWSGKVTEWYRVQFMRVTVGR